MELNPGDWIAYRPRGFFAKPFAVAQVEKATAKQVKVSQSSAFDRQVDPERVIAVIAGDIDALRSELDAIAQRASDEIARAKERHRLDATWAIAKATHTVS